MDDKLQTQILAAAKLKPKDGEDAKDFTMRVAKKLHGISEKEWDATPEPVQGWVNATILADEQGGELSLLELPEEVEESAEAKAQEESQEETAEAEVEQESAVSAKTAKNKPIAKKPGGDPPHRKKPTEKAAAPKPAAKPKAAAKPTPAKKPVAAKKPAAAKGDRGRKPLFPDDGKIKVLVKDNPHRDGTVRDKAFKKVKSGMTVAEAVKAGAPRQQVWSMWKRGVISVAGAQA